MFIFTKLDVLFEEYFKFIDNNKRLTPPKYDNLLKYNDILDGVEILNYNATYGSNTNLRITRKCA